MKSIKNIVIIVAVAIVLAKQAKNGVLVKPDAAVETTLPKLIALGADK